MDQTLIGVKYPTIIKDGGQWGKSNDWIWNGVRCHWRVLGSNQDKPILFLHGFGASSAHWRHNAAAIASAGFCVYGLDLIGFGESEQPSRRRFPKLDNQIWADQVSAFLEEVVKTKTFGKAILIGNSLGGLTAITALSFRPDLVCGVVAAPLPDPAFLQKKINTCPIWLEELSNNLVKVFFILLPLELLIPLISRTVIIKIALQQAYYNSIKSDKELHRIVSKPARKRTAARTLRAMCIGMATRKKSITAPSLLDKLSNWKNPAKILLIWGKNDNLVPFKISNQIIKHHPWINLIVLDQTGHCPHDEAPTQFNQYVLSWLNSTK